MENITNGKKVVEIEQCCVETNTMDFEDYLECRNFSFVLRLISSQAFLPIYKLCKQLNISWFQIAFKLYQLLKDANTNGKLKEIFDGFSKESNEELFETKEEAINFYTEPKNYEKLINGEIGDNLLGKYSAIGLLNIKDVISSIFFIIKKQINLELNEKDNIILDSSEKWLKNIYIIERIFDKDLTEQKDENIKFDFDFQSWLNNDNQPIDNFIKSCEYKFSVESDKIENFKRELKVISKAKTEIALGKYFMMQAARSFSFFEKNYVKIN